MRTVKHLFHLAEPCNFPSIERHGLLSTSKLLELAGFSREERRRLEREQRQKRMSLPNGVMIRDQSPMPPSALAGCLADGMRPDDWYALLNTMVFFWVDEERLVRQARACGSRQLKIEIDADRFLARYKSIGFVTPINSGNARRRPAWRGRASFVPFVEWERRGWAYESAALGTKERPGSHSPAELTVPDAVPDIMDYVIGVQEVPDGWHESGGVASVGSERHSGGAS